MNRTSLFLVFVVLASTVVVVIAIPAFYPNDSTSSSAAKRQRQKLEELGYRVLVSHDRWYLSATESGARFDDGVADILVELDRVYLELGNLPPAELDARQLGRLSELDGIVLPNDTKDHDIRRISQAMPQVHHLSLAGSSISDSGVEFLTKQKRLTSLDLRETQVGDAACETISRIGTLVLLELGGTRVSDSGVSELSNLPLLDSLYLERTAITDDSIRHMLKFKSLKMLNVAGTAITPKGIARLQEKRSNLKIVSEEE